MTAVGRDRRLERGYGHGVAVGDYDNDGRPDLFVTRWRSLRAYHNRGDGTFEDVTAQAGLGGDRDWPTSAAFADLDGDGDLDLYVCHYLDWDAENPQALPRPADAAPTCPAIPATSRRCPTTSSAMTAAGSSTSRREAGIVDPDGRGLGVVAADLDGDGRIDLFVANDMTANYLFRNLGGFRFEEVGHPPAWPATPRAGTRRAWASPAATSTATAARPGRDQLLRRVDDSLPEPGRRALQRPTAASRPGGCRPATCSASGSPSLDVNNDGRLDLMTANGHVDDHRPEYPYEMPAQLLAGGQAGRLTTTRIAAGRALMPCPGSAEVWQPATSTTTAGSTPWSSTTDHPLAYLHNQTSGGGHFLTLRLEGRHCSRDAVGVRVVVVAGGRRQFRWRIGGGSYQSASDSRLHFGLGASAIIDRLEVLWPCGVIQQFTNLPPIEATWCVRAKPHSVDYLVSLTELTLAAAEPARRLYPRITATTAGANREERGCLLSLAPRGSSKPSRSFNKGSELPCLSIRNEILDDSSISCLRFAHGAARPAFFWSHPSPGRRFLAAAHGSGRVRPGLPGTLRRGRLVASTSRAMDLD